MTASRSDPSADALVVAAGEPGQLAGFAKRPALLVAADSGLHTVVDRGWVPDVVIGDMDSVDAELLGRVRDAGARVERRSPDKDETDLELALGVVLDAGVASVHVVVRDDGRLDHQVANLVVLAAPRLARLAVAASVGEHRVWVVRGRRAIPLPEGAQLALQPIGGDAVVTTTGVRFGLHDERLSPFAGRGIANEVAGGPATVEVSDGVVLVISSPTQTSERDAARG